MFLLILRISFMGNMILIKDRHSSSNFTKFNSAVLENMILIKDRHKRAADKQSANHAREI